MATTPEELALDLSSASVRAQERTETYLRERATAVLAAASIVVPVAAVAVDHGPAGAALPFGAAAIAYSLCVRECGAALLPRGVDLGLLGGELLAMANASEASLGQMQVAAAAYLDREYRHNQTMLQMTAERVRRAITFFTLEVLSLAVAMFSILTH